MVRKQRARAAHLYKSVVSWSLWYAHRTSMPEGGWVVDVDKCVCVAASFSTNTRRTVTLSLGAKLRNWAKLAPKTLRQS
ncbi:hypothetical protein JG687_00014812 [Phytophthora cactorum]|uniref:Uncharacterized protein n=1 Tax=Phytophthora cactorum TaxID=29920 RepID=A0A8T1TYP3_9STRA|nr:hypothetical protein JG687_00014812 [Phytophthora cactorum]